MHCPQCGQSMIKESWIAGRLGNIIALDALFWLLVLFVFLTGLFGFALAVIAIAAFIARHWGKAWYSCPHCSNSLYADD